MQRTYLGQPSRPIPRALLILVQIAVGIHQPLQPCPCAGGHDQDSWRLQVISNKALEAVADGLLPRLRPILEEVGTASYQLSDADYACGGLEGGWVVQLAGCLQLQLVWLQPLLTPACWEGLTLLLLYKLLARLEVLLGRKVFSQLGGLQLDKDVRSLVAAAGELTSRPIRDKFARLTQMAIALSLESVEEFLDYWGYDTGHTTWRLTPSEVRAVLQQRPDFSRDTIAALPL